MVGQKSQRKIKFLDPYLGYFWVIGKGSTIFSKYVAVETNLEYVAKKFAVKLLLSRNTSQKVAGFSHFQTLISK